MSHFQMIHIITQTVKAVESKKGPQSVAIKLLKDFDNAAFHFVSTNFIDALGHLNAGYNQDCVMMLAKIMIKYQAIQSKNNTRELIKTFTL